MNIKTVLFQVIQFSISTQFSSIWPIDRTLSGAATAGQSGAGSKGNEEVFHIPHSNSITGTSSSDYLVSYPGHLLGGLTPLQRCSWCILQPQPTVLWFFLQPQYNICTGTQDTNFFLLYCFKYFSKYLVEL